MLSGYPPKEIPTYNPAISLRDLDLKSGETIIVSELSELRENHDIHHSHTGKLSDMDCNVHVGNDTIHSVYSGLVGYILQHLYNRSLYYTQCLSVIST